MTSTPSTRQELEEKIRRLVGPVEGMRSESSTGLKSSGAALGFIAALVAFAWGRRRGRHGH
ncbi:MAG: hypothetical protein KJS64_04540 [Acidobacteria bacterium]|nr:hypothetical protein [Acidobacteriota bacterium]